MVLVLSNGRPPVIPWESKNVPAIIEAFYGGQSGGQAVADVLFGSYNPSGRLPISFARSAGALPSFYNGPPTFFQNGYLDSDATPVYPFGYGLSYTQFVYENFDVFPKTISRKDEKASLTFSFVVRNVGASDGDEVPQLYRLGHVSSVTLPYKQLVGLTRIHIPQGSSKEVLMVLPVHKWLSVWNRTMDWDLETGSREFVIGPDSQREWGNVTVHIAS